MARISAIYISILGLILCGVFSRFSSFRTPASLATMSFILVSFSIGDSDTNYAFSRFSLSAGTKRRLFSLLRGSMFWTAGERMCLMYLYSARVQKKLFSAFLVPLFLLLHLERQFLIFSISLYIHRHTPFFLLFVLRMNIPTTSASRFLMSFHMLSTQ